MKKRNLFEAFQRWRTSRVELLRELEVLRKDNESLRQKLTAVQHARDQAEKHAEDRRREKESLRTKLGAQKKSSESNEQQIEQFGAKITELRAENERLKRKKK